MKKNKNLIHDVVLAILVAALLFLSISELTAKTIELTPNNHINFKGEVNFVSASIHSKRLLFLNAHLPENAPIYIVLTSGGGSVMAGIDFIRIIEMVQLNRPVHTISVWAFSMAFSIAQHGSVRYIDKYGTMGQHRAKGNFNGQFADGEIEQRLKYITSVIKSLNTYEANRCGYSYGDWKNLLRDEYWGYSEEAKKQGFVDEVVTLTCSKKLGYKCPLI